MCNSDYQCPVCNYYNSFEQLANSIIEESNYKCNRCGYEYNESNGLITISIKDIAAVYSHVPYDNKYENIKFEYFFHFDKVSLDEIDKLEAMQLLLELEHTIITMERNKWSIYLLNSNNKKLPCTQKRNFNTLQALKYSREQKNDLELLIKDMYGEYAKLEPWREIYNLALQLEKAEDHFLVVKAKDIDTNIEAISTVHQIVYNKITYAAESSEGRQLWKKH